MHSSSFRAGITTERSDRRNVDPVVTEYRVCSVYTRHTWRGLVGPQIKPDTIGLKRVDKESDEQTDIRQGKPKCNVDSGDDAGDSLAKDAKEKKQGDVCRNA